MKRLTRLGACIAASILLSLAGCDTSNGVDLNSPETLAEVQSGALAAAVAAPSSDIAGDLIVAMMGAVDPAPLARGGGAGESGGDEPACPESFDLGNGITGTCSATPEGVVTFVFGGSIPMEGAAAAVSGTLVAAPASSQPSRGTAHDIDFDASVSSSLGDASWSSLGTVTRDELGRILDYSFTMTHTVTPAGGATAVVTTVLTPSRFELVVTGPLGGTLRFVMNRDTMGGVVLLDGVEVAEIDVVDGCVSIDFLGAGLTDEVVCPRP